MLKIEKQIIKKILEIIEKELKIKISLGEVVLKFPPKVELGDFCFGTFEIAKKAGKTAQETAKIIAQNIGLDILDKIEAIGPYLNFKVKNEVLFEAVLNEITKKGIAEKIEKPEKIMVEYLSPNTNKPLHLGHLRNGALGLALGKILEASGHKVVLANLINDRGVHICKSMLAWLKWGQGQTPQTEKMKGDHFVGKWYVKYGIEEEKNPKLKDEIQTMLKKWEQGDNETRALWKKMNTWVYQGFEETYKKFGLKFDAFFYESETYKLGKDIVEQGLKNGILQKEADGSVTATLPEKKFGLDQNGKPNKKVLLRADGTSVYTTQDLGAAVLKFKKYGLDRSIYVVGAEQDYHFKCLFEILKQIGFKFAKKCFHLSYGMVYLPEGKMKSREGKVVDADGLISEMEAMAQEEIKKRDQKNILSAKEIAERANKIALSAIKFYLLMPLPKSDIHFDPKKSLSFEGKTGPYCQYGFARTKNILKKAKEAKLENKKLSKIAFSLLKENQALALLRGLLEIKIALKEAEKELNPSKLAQAVYNLASVFSQFYQALPVINEKEPQLSQARLKLVEATSKALEQGLNLLGIETLDEM